MSDFSFVHVPLVMLDRKAKISLADCDFSLDGVGTPIEIHCGNLLIYLNLMSIIPGVKRTPSTRPRKRMYRYIWPDKTAIGPSKPKRSEQNWFFCRTFVLLLVAFYALIRNSI